MLELVYYTRKNCQLCDDGREQIKLALSELRYNKVKLTSFDIDEDDRLQQEYMVRVPVLKHKGEVVQEGLIDFVRVYNYLKEYLGESKILIKSAWAEIIAFFTICAKLKMNFFFLSSQCF